MASHWFNRNAAGSSNISAGSSNNSAGSYGNEKPEEDLDLDLSLKLGLPDEHNSNTNLINPVPGNPVTYDYLSNMNFDSSPYQGESLHRPVGGQGSHEYRYGMAGQPNPGFGNNFPMNDQGRMMYYGSNKLHDMGNYQYYQNRINPMGSRVENHFNMMNAGAGGSIMAANRNPSGYSTIAFPPPLTINEYTLIDTPARRSRNVEIHEPFLDGSTAAAVRGGHRQHTGTNNKPNRRCSNFNCGATDTPMWRRGPLGPKSLCNACGIKYRKEEEKRKGKEASSSSG